MWNISSLLIDQLYIILCDVLVTAHFKIGFYLFFLLICKNSVYLGYQSFVQYIFSEYFPQWVACLIFLMVYFDEQKF